MFFVAAAGAFVTLVALLRVVVVVGVGVLVFLFLGFLGDWVWEGFLALELFLFDSVDGRNRTNLFPLRSRFLLFVNGRHSL